MTFAYCHADSSICTCTYHKRAAGGEREGGRGCLQDMKQHKATQVVPKFSLIKRKTQDKKKTEAQRCQLFEQVLHVFCVCLCVCVTCRQNYFNLCNVAHLTATFCHARNLSCQWATHTQWVCLSLQNMLNAKSICSQLWHVYSIALSKQATCRALHLMDYLCN